MASYNLLTGDPDSDYGSSSGVPSGDPQGGGGGFPWAKYLLGGFSGLGNFFGARNNAKTAKEIEAMRIAEQQRAQNQTTAFQESQLDPYRQLMMQGRDLSRLDMQQFTKPTQAYGISDPKTAAIVGATPYDRSQPRTPSYAPSADLLNWLGSIKTNVASGQNQAPTMTNPANYGKSSVLDLLALQAGNGDPATARGRNQTPLPASPQFPADPNAPGPGSPLPTPPGPPPQGYPTNPTPPVPLQPTTPGVMVPNARTIRRRM
jgi:hypothetical protein